MASSTRFWMIALFLLVLVALIVAPLPGTPLDRALAVIALSVALGFAQMRRRRPV